MKDFDWDAWVGPAPMKRYNKNRTFYRFRWFWEHSGGQLTNFGVHYLAQIKRAAECGSECVEGPDAMSLRDFLRALALRR